MMFGWVFSTAIVVGLQLYVRVGASYHVCCILSTIISSIYRLCITHKQLQSLLTFLYMHSLDWCLLQEVWIRLIMAKGQRHTIHKNINMWCMVMWMKIRCMLFRCWCTISIVRIIGKISWYWCFIWYRCTLTLFGLNYTLLFLVSIGMLIGMIRMHLWFISQADGRYIGIHNNWLSLVCTYETRDIMLWKQIQKVLISLATWYHNLYRMSDEVTINLHPLNDWKISFLCPNAARYDVWYNNKLWLRHWHWGLDIHIYIYCKNANRRSANCMWLWLYYLHSGWEVWNADSLHRSVSKNAIYIAWHVYLQLFDRARNK